MNIIRDHHASQSDISHIGGRKEGRKERRRAAANEQCRHKHHPPAPRSVRAQCDIPDRVGLLLIQDGHRLLFRKKSGQPFWEPPATPVSRLLCPFLLRKHFGEDYRGRHSFQKLGKHGNHERAAVALAPFCLPVCTACSHP